MKTKKKIRVVAAMVARNDQYLVTQRRSSAVLPLLWEFPGGRCEEGESDQQALSREFRERLNADVEVGQLVSYVDHEYEGYCLDLYLYECRLLTDSLQAVGVNDFRWVRSQDFNSLEFTPADEASMNQLLNES